MPSADLDRWRAVSLSLTRVLQTYADAFLIITICFAIATEMVPLMRKAAPPKAPVADAH